MFQLPGTPCRRNACSRKIAFMKFHNFLVNLYISGYLDKNFMLKIPDNITSIKTLLKKIVAMVQVHKNWLGREFSKFMLISTDI